MLFSFEIKTLNMRNFILLFLNIPLFGFTQALCDELPEGIAKDLCKGHESRIHNLEVWRDTLGQPKRITAYSNSEKRQSEQDKLQNCVNSLTSQRKTLDSLTAKLPIALDSLQSEIDSVALVIDAMKQEDSALRLKTDTLIPQWLTMRDHEIQILDTVSHTRLSIGAISPTPSSDVAQLGWNPQGYGLLSLQDPSISYGISAGALPSKRSGYLSITGNDALKYPLQLSMDASKLAIKVGNDTLARLLSHFDSKTNPKHCYGRLELFQWSSTGVPTKVVDLGLNSEYDGGRAAFYNDKGHVTAVFGTTKDRDQSGLLFVKGDNYAVAFSSETLLEKDTVQWRNLKIGDPMFFQAGEVVAMKRNGRFLERAFDSDAENRKPDGNALRVVGVITEAGGIRTAQTVYEGPVDEQQYVAVAGVAEVFVVPNKNSQSVLPGQLLVPSGTRGCAMAIDVADADKFAGAVIGKVLEAHNWSESTKAVKLKMLVWQH